MNGYLNLETGVYFGNKCALKIFGTCLLHKIRNRNRNSEVAGTERLVFHHSKKDKPAFLVRQKLCYISVYLNTNYNIQDNIGLSLINKDSNRY